MNTQPKKSFFKRFWWIIIIILFIGGTFSWFLFFPPSEIRAVCDKTAIEKAKEKYMQEGQDAGKESFPKDDYNFYYERCLEEHFLFK